VQKVQYISGSCEGELTETIGVNTAQIPAPVRDSLAAATLDMIYGILRQPGGRDALDAKIAARKAATTAKERS